MTQTEQFIRRLEMLQEADRSQLRRVAGKQLNEALQGFDLFTGLWWPLRDGPAAPRKETSWLVAKLYAAFGIRNDRSDKTEAGPTLARILGWCEPRDDHSRHRFRARFDACCCVRRCLHWSRTCAGHCMSCRMPSKREMLRHGLGGVAQPPFGLVRGEEHRLGRDIRDIWAEDYLNAVHQSERRN